MKASTRCDRHWVFRSQANPPDLLNNPPGKLFKDWQTHKKIIPASIIGDDPGVVFLASIKENPP